MHNLEETKIETNIMKNIYLSIKKYVPFIGISAVLAIIAAILMLIAPNKLSEIVDVISQGLKGEMDFDKIINLGIIVCGMYILSAVFIYIKSYIMTIVAQNTAKNLRNRVFEKIDRLPMTYFDNVSYGDVISRITNDVNLLGATIGDGLIDFIAALALFFGSLILMFSINAKMTWVAIASVIIGFVFIILIMIKSQSFFNSKQNQIGILNGHIQEVLCNYSAVKSYAAEEEMKSHFTKIVDNLYDNEWKADIASSVMSPLMTFVGNLGYISVCITGSILVMNNEITFGIIVAFIVYVNMFTQPLQQIGQTSSMFQLALAAAERIFGLLNEKEIEKDDESKVAIKEIQGNIVFKDVSFGYNEEKMILNNINLTVRKGEKIAIVGPTGAGKTTLVNLMLKFYKITKGDIIVDGVSINDINTSEIRNIFGMVLQDTWIFQGSVKENIIYSTPGISDKRLVEVCKLVGIDHYIRTLEKGYDTIIDNKTNISEGQKQLIAIARALIKDSPIMILDEATSLVDTMTEEIIQEAVDKVTEGRTTFIIAHRLSTIKNADRILVLKEGSIIECGNHQELMNEKGYYYKLFNSQFN